MRLLPKSEVNSRKAQERQAEISEGKKLAERVDRLREVQASEEASLTRFRNKTVAEINQEVTVASKERDNLLNEVRLLKKQRTALLVPLDSEWAKLNEAKDLHKKEVDSNALSRNDLEGMRREVAKDKKEVKTTLAQVKSQLEGAKAEADRALKAKEMALDAKKRADAMLLSTTDWQREVTKELNIRDTNVKLKESGVKIREEWVEREKEKIIKEWRLVLDRKAMYERYLKSKNI